MPSYRRTRKSPATPTEDIEQHPHPGSMTADRVRELLKDSQNTEQQPHQGSSPVASENPEEKWRSIRENDQKLIKECSEKLEALRLSTLLRFPFIGGLAMYMRTHAVVDARIRTAATDGKNIYFNAYFLKHLLSQKQGQEKACFVFAHEVWHAALLHFARCGTRDRDLFNIATDVKINDMLKAEFKDASPEEACYGENILKGDWPKYRQKTEEEIYDWLVAHLPKARQQSGQQAGQQAGQQGGQQAGQQSGQQAGQQSGQQAGQQGGQQSGQQAGQQAGQQ
ncbi:MAG: hypothetical protein N3A02_03570, partial [Rectinema sp.]|nr:hypothetical protein [Rectinema sp.]